MGGGGDGGRSVDLTGSTVRCVRNERLIFRRTLIKQCLDSL
jgi:hypothetical protein